MRINSIDFKKNLNTNFVAKNNKKTAKKAEAPVVEEAKVEEVVEEVKAEEVVEATEEAPATEEKTEESAE